MLKNLRWGKNWPGGEKNWLVIFFFRGKEWLVTFFPGEEVGWPDPSQGKDWQGEKTDRYTGKPEVHPEIFSVVKKLLKNVTIQILNFIPVS